MEEEKKRRTNRKTKLRSTTYNRQDFVSMVAEKALFTKKDVDYILHAIEEVLAEIIGEKKSLSISRIFKMYLTERISKRDFNAYTGEFEDGGKSYYASFKASRYLLRYLPEMKDKFQSLDDEGEDE